MNSEPRPILTAAEFGDVTRADVLSSAKRLLQLLVRYSTGAGGSNEEYEALRAQLAADSQARLLLPEFVRRCRDLGHFWDFIKPKFAHYAERREFLRDEFAPMLDVLEGSPSPTPEAAVDRWKPYYFRLFISHSAKYKAFAQDIQEKVSRYKISAFVAHMDISPTAEWQLQIELALRECDALAALLTPDFHSRVWTDQEVGWVLGLGKPVIGVRLGADPYGFLGKYQGLGKFRGRFTE